MNVASGSAFEACVDTGVTGMTGTCSLRIQDNDGNDVQAPSTADITEQPAGSGIYCAQRTAPIPLGQYSLVWSDDGSFTPAHVAIEDLVIVSAEAGTELPPIQEAEDGYAGGPCRAWTTPEDAAACCGDQTRTRSTSRCRFASPASSCTRCRAGSSSGAASAPCAHARRMTSAASRSSRAATSSPGTARSGWARRSPDRRAPAAGVSRVLLPNYPVREIIEVKIDGVALDPSEYRIDGKRWLARMRDEDGNRRLWPRCQALDMDSSEDGNLRGHVPAWHGDPRRRPDGRAGARVSGAPRVRRLLLELRPR